MDCLRKSKALFCDFSTNMSEVPFPKITASMTYQYGLLNRWIVASVKRAPVQ